MLVSVRELIPLFRAALERGQRVAMTVNGSSMMPFIRDGDIVELANAGIALEIGSVVLAQLSEEYYILHRIVAQYDDSTLLLRGDYKTEPDGLITCDNIIGVVTQIIRNGHRVRLASGYTGKIIGWLSGHGILLPVTRALFFPRRVIEAVCRIFHRLHRRILSINE